MCIRDSTEALFSHAQQKAPTEKQLSKHSFRVISAYYKYSSASCLLNVYENGAAHLGFIMEQE